MPNDNSPFGLDKRQPDEAHEGMRVAINDALQSLRDQQDAIEFLLLQILGG